VHDIFPTEVLVPLFKLALDFDIAPLRYRVESQIRVLIIHLDKDKIGLLKQQSSTLGIDFVGEFAVGTAPHYVLPEYSVLFEEMTQQKMRRSLFCASSDYKSFDITLIADNKEIKAHKAMLCTRCEYFKAMFTGPMKESSKDNVNILDISYLALLSLVEYSYTDDIKYKYDIALELLATANIYLLPRLGKLVEQFMTKELNHKNVIIVYDNLQALPTSTVGDLQSFCLWYLCRYEHELGKIPKQIDAKIKAIKLDPKNRWPSKKEVSENDEKTKEYDARLHGNTVKKDRKPCSIQ